MPNLSCGAYKQENNTFAQVARPLARAQPRRNTRRPGTATDRPAALSNARQALASKAGAHVVFGLPGSVAHHAAQGKLQVIAFHKTGQKRVVHVRPPDAMQDQTAVRLLGGVGHKLQEKGAVDVTAA